MGRSFIFILLPLALSAQLDKFVYEDEKKTWTDAQKHCRDFYTDLASVSNKFDMEIMHKLAGDADKSIWIGLMRNTSDHNKWMWSGGGEVSTTFWGPTEPNDWNGNEDYGILHNYSWNDAPDTVSVGFICYKVDFIRELKTWEEALRYCRKHHSDLASVTSETELMLIQKELGKKFDITENVWIGLHFLTGEWMWVDGEPYRYEAWGPGGKPWCPAESMFCGALQVSMVFDNGRKVVQRADVWNAHKCQEKLYFLCY